MVIEVQGPKVIQYETIETLGSAEHIKGISSAKSFRTWLQSRINLYRRRNNLEVVFMLEGIKQAYDKFHPSLSTSINIDAKYGVSGIQKVIEKIDFFEVTTWRKSGPFIINIPKHDVECVIKALASLNMKENIKTEHIAAAYCRIAGINDNNKGKPLFDEHGFIWNNFFGWRIAHLRFTILLGLLSIKGLIHYEKGLTKILDLNLPVSFQTHFTKQKV